MIIPATSTMSMCTLVETQDLLSGYVDAHMHRVLAEGGELILVFGDKNSETNLWLDSAPSMHCGINFQGLAYEFCIFCLFLSFTIGSWLAVTLTAARTHLGFYFLGQNCSDAGFCIINNIGWCASIDGERLSVILLLEKKMSEGSSN